MKIDSRKDADEFILLIWMLYQRLTTSLVHCMPVRKGSFLSAVFILPDVVKYKEIILVCSSLWLPRSPALSNMKTDNAKMTATAQKRAEKFMPVWLSNCKWQGHWWDQIECVTLRPGIMRFSKGFKDRGKFFNAFNAISLLKKQKDNKSWGKT